MVSLGKCNRRCNVPDDLSAKACVASKTKDVDVKVFNLITKINEAKKMI